MILVSLKGKTVAILRPERQAHELARIISKFGGKPYVAPVMEIKPTKNEHQVREFVNKLVNGRIDYVIFMSRNGVTSLIETSKDLQLETELLKALNKITIVTIGPKTGGELKRYGVKFVLVSKKYSSEGVIEILRNMNLKGKTVAVLRSKDANPYLRNELKRMEAHLLEISVYESALPFNDSRVLKLLSDLLNGEIDIITFTSSSSAKNLFKIADQHALADKLRTYLKKKVVVVAIGPTTRRTLNELKVKVDIMPKQYTIKTMVKALMDCLTNRKPVRFN